MLILKFIREYSSTSSSLVNVVTCNHYEVYTRPGGAKTVTTYRDHTRLDGVERHITAQAPTGRSCDPDPEGYFDYCFVENENGKTVDTIRVNVQPSVG